MQPVRMILWVGGDEGANDSGSVAGVGKVEGEDDVASRFVGARAVHLSAQWSTFSRHHLTRRAPVTSIDERISLQIHTGDFRPRS